MMSDVSVITLVPVYKPELDEVEQYSLDCSLAALPNRDIRFIGPASLDYGYYASRYPHIPEVRFPDEYFASIQGYNRLLLSVEFYEYFAAAEFMLVLQTDAVVLRDELDHWCNQPFDYVGAPWPEGVELFVNLGRFAGDKGRRVRAMVGNGGLSLRRIRKCISLLREFPDATEYFNLSGSSEDLFFSLMGPLSSDFVLPNEITASLFSMELKPSYYYSVNGMRLPMGCHAWTKYEPAFWAQYFPVPPPLIQS
jgi:hypothetical protein